MLGAVSRHSVARWSLVGDLVMGAGAYAAALTLRFDWLGNSPRAGVLSIDWTLAVVVLSILGSFHAWGLYKSEVFALRSLHVFTLVKATLAAFVTTAVIVYLAKSGLLQQSRLVIGLAFVLAFVGILAWRLAVLTPWYVSSLSARNPRTLVLGRSPEVHALIARLDRLRGFTNLRVVEPSSRNDRGGLAAGALVEEGGDSSIDLEHVFIDTASLAPRVTLRLVEAAKATDAEVYVLSRLLSPLDSTRLLTELFDQPVMRVRLHPHERRARLSKRLFDVPLAGVALVLLSPLLALIAVGVKLSSPGPVFYVQERVGLRGSTFRFLKFRSMVVGSGHDLHREYVCRLIDGEVVCDSAFDSCQAGAGAVTHKISDDPRVTRLGRILRKYSLDELPQFWHVVTGEMSLVGPRPALPYEVERYKAWHRERLNAVPGVSGLWQVAGRSRVGFDDMVLEDVMYTYNQGLMTDLGICLRTVPVVLFGRGAA